MLDPCLMTQRRPQDKQLGPMLEPIMGVDKFLKVGGAKDVFLLEITSFAHFSHAHQSFDS